MEPTFPFAKFRPSAEITTLWQRGAEQRQAAMAEATQQMLDVAELKPGDHVLDIAAGTGEQSRLAARRVGPTGQVLATDISEEMLTVAAQLAEQEGLNTVQTRVMNAERLELNENSFDAVICRYGLMILPDLQKALSEIKRVLKPGKKLAALVWSRPESNPFFHLFALSKKIREASGHLPGPFTLSDPAVFAGQLEAAGFRAVETRVLTFQLRYPSLDAFLQTSQGEQDEQQVEVMKQALKKFEGPEGLILPGKTVLGVGTK
uniref:Methyltransferase domain-containing protein n=1 Tax=Thermosporothrix sp. COM3 TaxID=2490863 RepID=A0A455SXJ8_9CHLR|nr:hypothetical protein KTC_63730 [Thermosporothrix sp. COM3]